MMEDWVKDSVEIQEKEEKKLNKLRRTSTSIDRIDEEEELDKSSLALATKKV